MFLLAVIDAGRWLAPPSRRREWRRQWRADIWHESRWLARQQQARTQRSQRLQSTQSKIGSAVFAVFAFNVRQYTTLGAWTAGALRHAFWLRLHVRKLEMITQDVRDGWRLLVSKPGFTAIAVLTLGVGIGANITIFSLTNAVLLRPLASYEPDRVVRLIGRTETGGATRFSYREFVDYRERATTLDDLAAVNLGTFILAADNRSDQLLGEIVSGGYLSMLGARAARGRVLGRADDSPGAAPAAMISDALWRRRFGGEPVVGRRVLLNGTGYTIVGVAAPSLVGSFIGAPIDVWIPIATSGNALGPGWDVDRSKRRFSLVGRLRPGATREQCESELQVVAAALAREYDPELRPIVDVVPGTLATGDQRRLARTFLMLLL